MTMSAVCLRGEASKKGWKIFHIPQAEASTSGLDPGGHVWTEHARTPYELLSRTDDADAAVISLLDAETDEHFGAFTSNYGPLWHTRNYKDGECTPLAELRRMAWDLRRLHGLLLAGDFTEANPLPNGLVMSPFSVAFNLWLLPEKNVRGCSPVFMTHSLYCFLAHELITRALENRPLLVCHACGGLHRPTRRDAKFCGPECRSANFREVHRPEPVAGR
jgi:hypothetical protein